MSYDLARVQKEFTEVCNKAGTQVTSPIELNGRLTRTLGRVISYGTKNYLNNSKVEFSKQLLATCSDDTIRDVIMHEAAHYIANDRTHINHGHDTYFKAVCAEIGTTNDGTVTQTERTVAASEIYKYTVSCPNCGPLGYYHRMSKTLKNISHCSCRKCGSHDLSVIQNY